MEALLGETGLRQANVTTMASVGDVIRVTIQPTALALTYRYLCVISNVDGRIICKNKIHLKNSISHT